MSAARTYRILVVDDESAVLVTYRLILEREGYAVVACSTSREAVDAIRKQAFDAVLCDYSLEEQHTGFEVITEARKRNSRVPAVLLTGYATQETADEAERRNIGVMFKPIEIEEFLETTASMLRRDHESNKSQGGKQEEPAAKSDGAAGKQQRAAGDPRTPPAGDAKS